MGVLCTKDKEFLNSYANFLGSQEWDYFVTFTTGYELTLKSARRAMERFNDRWAKLHGGSRLFWVAEPFECKDGFHTHALLYINDRSLVADKRRTVKTLTADNALISLSLKEPAFDLVKSCWQTVTCADKENYNRIELKRYDQKLGAKHYVGKYILKTRSDYDILI